MLVKDLLVQLSVEYQNLYNLSTKLNNIYCGSGQTFALTVNNTCSDIGNITLTLNGVDVAIYISTCVATTTQLAELIRDAINNNTSYTATFSANVVTITSSSLQPESAPTFTGGATGITATTEVTFVGNYPLSSLVCSDLEVCLKSATDILDELERSGISIQESIAEISSLLSVILLS